MSWSSNAPKTRANAPVLRDLRAVGYTYPDPLAGLQDAFTVRDRTGKRVSIKIQKRNGTEKARGQHSCGVSYRHFSKVDAFVFWIRGLDRLLLIPTSRLSEIFEQCQDANSVRKGQWLVAFHFDSNMVFLQPTNSDVPYDITDCALTIPQTASQ